MIQLLFRKDLGTLDEFDFCKRHFNVVENRSDILPNSLVIPRYSALPFYKELEYDVRKLGGKLINTHEQFNYIANFEYYHDIEKYTFKTYFDPCTMPDIPMVVKGRTNSRKHQFNSLFFAKNKRDAIEISCELRNDALIGSQDIIFREYCQLKTFEILLNGLPVSNEYRLFFLGDKLICHGYYWSTARDVDKTIDDEGLELAQKVANIVSKKNNFFVVDVAQKENGEWIVVELNSGEMSGLSLCCPDRLYGMLNEFLKQG